MGLADIFNPYFSTNVRSRGGLYFKKGRIQIIHVNASTLDATCKGSKVYDVLLTRDNGDIVASCTCPFFMGTAPCKHLWALLLAVDDEGYWRHVTRGSVSGSNGSPKLMFPNAAPGHEDWGGEAATQEQSNGADPASRHVPSIGPRPLSDVSIDDNAAPFSRKHWEAVLDSVMLSQTRVEPVGIADDLAGRQIHYLIDPNLFRDKLELVVRLSTRKMLKNERWGRPRELKIHSDAIASLPDARDRQILMLLSGASRGRWGYYGAERIDAEYSVPSAMEPVLIPRMCETERLFVWNSERAETIGPIRLDDGPPWQMRFVVDVLADGRGNRVEAKWVRDSEERKMADAIAVISSGWIVWNDMLSRARHYGCSSIREVLGNDGCMCVSAGDWHAFLDRLLGLEELPPLSLPESLRIEQLRPMARPVLNVVGEEPGEPLFADLRFDYGGTIVEPGRDGCGIMRVDGSAMVMRDAESERVARQQLQSAGFSNRMYAAHYPDAEYSITPLDFSRAVRELLAAGWQVNARGKPYRVPDDFKFNVSSGIDWFELRAACRFDDAEASLPDILKAIKKGQSVVTLGDGSVGILPDDWLKKFGYFIESAKVCGDHLRFKPSQVALLDALLAAQPAVSCDEMFQLIRDRLAGFETISPADPPASIQRNAASLPEGRAGMAQVSARP